MQAGEDWDFAGTDAASRSLIETCSLEIAMQQALFYAVVVPTGMIVIPAVLIAFCLHLGAHAIGETVSNLQWIAGLIDASWSAFGTTGGLLLLGVWIWSLARSRGRSSTPERHVRPLSGGAGDELRRIFAELWRLVPGRRGPPELTWFPNFNVLARAIEIGPRQEVQVSSALWERAVRRDPVAIGILAHEAAHLLFHDAPRLRRLEASVRTAHAISRAAAAGILLSAAASAVAIVSRPGRFSMLELVFSGGAVIALAVLMLMIPFLTDLAIRRQAALTTALIEIRADAYAGVITSGLSGFAQSLSRDPGVRESSLADLRHSLLSPDLTHLSNAERIALLSDPVRLTTPKLRYLALSLALPFLLPLNPLTPLMAGGALDYALIGSAVVIAHAAAVGMIVLGAAAAPLPWNRAVQLGAFLCAAAMLPLINLYEVGYLLTHFAAALVVPGGFGLGPTTWRSVLNDAETALGGLADKILQASGGLGFLLAVGCSALAVRLMSDLGRWAASETGPTLAGRLSVLPSVVAAVVTMASVFDEWRAPDWKLFAPAAWWVEATVSVPWIRLSAPELVGCSVVLLQVVGLRFHQAGSKNL